MQKNLGKVTKENDGFKVVLSRTLNHPIDVVWDALINPEKLRIWFAMICGDFRPEGEILIQFEDEQRTVSKARIVTMEKPHLFEFEWENELASWKLSRLGAQATLLTLTYSRLTDDYAISVSAGWHQIIDQLETVLAGRTEPFPFGAGPTDEGNRLKKEYRKVLLTDYPQLWETVKDEEPVTVRKEFNAPLSRVWRALTEKNEMKQWYFDLEEFKPEPGFVFEFTAGSEKRRWPHRCKVIEVITGRKLTYTWEYPGYEGRSYVVWEIFEEAGKTVLVLRHYGLDTFPADVPELARTNFADGWNSIIGQALPAFISRD